MTNAKNKKSFKKCQKISKIIPLNSTFKKSFRTFLKILFLQIFIGIPKKSKTYIHEVYACVQHR